MKSHKTIITSVIFFCIIIVVFRFISKPTMILSWDVFGYYLYLPAQFIHHDLTLLNQDWLTELINKYEPTGTLYQAIKLENGNWVMKYTMGLAILYAPFFFLAHLLANLFGYPPDGLSLIYQYTMAFGGILYTIIGLLFFTKVIKQFFDHYTCLLLLFCICFGTNYFQLNTFDGTLLSHNFLFTLYAILIYYTIKWHQKPSLKHAIFIGIACGFCTLIRPSEVICILIPLFWSISGISSFKNKLQLIKNNITHIIALATCVFIVFLPQIIYWKSVTGEYFFYSYTNPGEGLDLLSPYTFKFLFSFRKGWLLYTPIMIFSLVGFYYLFKKNRSIFAAITLFLILDIYIISSWTCWWYAGASYSSRSIVPAYVLLAIPLGYFIEDIKAKSKTVNIFFIVIFLFLVSLNLFQTWQFEAGIISKDRMTKAYYFATFGKTSVEEETKKLLLVGRFADANEIFDQESDYTQKTIYENHFDDLNDTSILFKGCFQMNNNVPFSPGTEMKYMDLTNCDHAWIRFSARVYIPNDFNEEFPLLVIHFTHNNGAYKYFAKGLDTSKIKLGEWNQVQLDYLTPEVRSIEDNF